MTKKVTFKELLRYYCVGISDTIFTYDVCKSSAPLGWNMQVGKNF